MEEAERFLLRLTGEEQRRLLNAMQTIEDILDDDSKPPTSYLFRLNSPGDIGWIIHRHGVVYSEEYGFDETWKMIQEGDLYASVLSLAALPNLFVFFIFIKKKQDYRARGVLMASIFTALITFVLKFL